MLPGKVRGTADPSASLGMTKGRVVVRWKVVAGPRRSATTFHGEIDLSFVIPRAAEG
jgi:hypothetical protein